MSMHKMQGKQKGFSTGCFLVGAIFIVSIVFLGVKLGPSYMEYRVMTNAVDEVIAAEDIVRLPPNEINRRLRASIKRNSGVNPTKLDLNKISYLGTRDGKRVVGVEYEVLTKLVYNISALMHFSYEKTAKTGG